MLETQIQELYDPVEIELSLLNHGVDIECLIHFANQDDQLHWLLTYDTRLTDINYQLQSYQVTSEYDSDGKTRNIFFNRFGVGRPVPR